MDETPTPAVENTSEEIVCLGDKLSAIKTDEQIGHATTTPLGQEEPSRRLDGERQRTQLGLPSFIGTNSMETQPREFSSAQQEEGTPCNFQGEEDGGVEMDGSLWGHLPELLIDSILSKLPVLSFFRLRAICKKWNALTSDPFFLEKCSQSPMRTPLFLLYADHARQSYPTYDPDLNAWHLLPQTCSCPGKSFVVMAAAGGLLCLADTNASQDLNLYVSNPMTKARRRLPPMLRMPNPYIVGMLMDGLRKSYKILMARNGEYLKLQVYDSATNSWQMTGSVQKRLALLVGTAYMQGTLYCLAFGTGISVSAYHIEQGTWEDLQAPMPPGLAWPQLFVSRGHLMLVGAIADCGVMKNVCVWQLDPAQLEWVQVLSVPNNLLEGLSRGHLGAHYLFVADGDYICFARYRVKQMLMCNVFKKSWWWLPLCPFDNCVDAPNLSGFPLQPSFHASV